jgi:hypothetical protein
LAHKSELSGQSLLGKIQNLLQRDLYPEDDSRILGKGDLSISAETIFASQYFFLGGCIRCREEDGPGSDRRKPASIRRSPFAIQDFCRVCEAVLNALVIDIGQRSRGFHPGFNGNKLLASRNSNRLSFTETMELHD